jgi:hypothetical protein
MNIATAKPVAAKTIICQDNLFLSAVGTPFSSAALGTASVVRGATVISS